jgi:hypothetical protein
MSDQLFGVILGGFFALAGVFLQRQWARQDHARELEERRMSEVRARVDERADRILTLLRELETRLLGKLRLAPSLWPSDRDESREIHRTLDEVLHEANYLIKPLRLHVEVLAHIVPDVDRLVQERWIRDVSARSIAWSTIRGARNAVARHLRAESVPPELGEPVAIYEKAWQDLQNMIEHQLEADMNRERDQESKSSDG